MTTDYTPLITSQHRSATKFISVVGLLTGEVAKINDVAQSIASKFDVDTAVGDQLDIIAQWLGLYRRMMVPDNVFFSFDTPALGFDQGLWKGTFVVAQHEISLTDDELRRYIKAMILASHWDGTLQNMHAILDAAMPPANTVTVVDLQSLELQVHVAGPSLSSTMESLLRFSALQGIKPAGVKLVQYFIP